jgi:hypothetical protein
MSERLIPAPPPGGLKPLLRVSGGNPAGFPDFVPLNPWGRGMPKAAPRSKPAVFQLVVRDLRNGGRELRVGPKCETAEIAEALCMAIKQQIELGREKRWADPQVINFTAELGKKPAQLFV